MHAKPSLLPTQASVPDPSAASGHTRRFLIVKFGSIGDVIMAIPAAAALWAEGYAIDWVASAGVAPILQLYPWIHVITVDEPKLLRGSRLERLRSIAGLWRQLRARVAEVGQYHTVATLYYDRRYSLLTATVSARHRSRLSHTDRRFLLIPGRHHTDEYARILTGRTDAETPWQLSPVSPPALPAPTFARQPGLARVVLVPAGARNALRDDALRRWPIANYVELASALVQHGCEVVLAGGPEDRWASPHFCALSEIAASDAFSDLIGTLSLIETLALLHSAVVTVTHDTGPLHMAGLTSTGIVTIFGPTDPHGRLPRRGNTVALWGGEGFACRPCYDGRDYAPCPHNGCMAQVTPAMVLAEVLVLIKTRTEGRVLAPRVAAPSPAPFVQIEAGGDA